MVQVPFLKAYLPPIETWAPYLSESYSQCHFSNFGPTEREYSQRCTSRWAASGYVAVPVASATAGLTAALIASDIRGRVLMPDFTFPATLQAVIMAGCEPVIIDVDSKHWEIDNNAVARQLATGNVAAVMPVRSYGFVRDQQELLEICGRYQCPVVIDGAAAFGHPDRRNSIGSPMGEIEVFSSHATKPFSTAEGGLVFAPTAKAAAIKEVINFGFDASRTFGLGSNAKMDEVRAAIGIAMLDCIEDIARQREELAKRYDESLRPFSSSLELATETGPTPWQCYPVRFHEPHHRELVAAGLLEEGIGTRRYYAPLMTQGFKVDAEFAVPNTTPVSEALANQMLCFPLYEQMTTAQLEHLFESLVKVIDRVTAREN